MLSVQAHTDKNEKNFLQNSPELNAFFSTSSHTKFCDKCFPLRMSRSPVIKDGPIPILNTRYYRYQAGADLGVVRLVTRLT